jgi:hypothetical protein
LNVSAQKSGGHLTLDRRVLYHHVATLPEPLLPSKSAICRESANGVGFDGYIGERWNRFFIIIDSSLRDAANVVVGDTLKMSVEPTGNARVLAQARKQSKVTTAPKTPRPDAIDPAEYRLR